MTVTDLAHARFARAVERLHRLGPRALCELLTGLGGRHLIRTEIEPFVARYSRIHPVVLAVAGGNRPPVPPTHRIADRLDDALGHLRAAEIGIEDGAALHHLDMLALAIEDARYIAPGQEPSGL
jgi:hypothetical protein